MWRIFRQGLPPALVAGGDRRVRDRPTRRCGSCWARSTSREGLVTFAELFSAATFLGRAP